MKIIAYTYEADVHCPACTKKAGQRMLLDHRHPYAMGTSWIDDNGIEYDLVNSEGNLIHPVFNTDEDPDGTFTRCGDCDKELS